MLRVRQVIQYLDNVYAGAEFVDLIVGMLDLMEVEYGEDRGDDGGDVDEDDYAMHADDRSPDGLYYKDIISALCDCRTPHAACAAELVLHRCESVPAIAADGRRRRRSRIQPTVETYNNVLTALATSGATSYPSPSHSPPYGYHPNPVSNLLSRMASVYGEDPVNNAAMRPDFISFNTAIGCLSGEQAEGSWRARAPGRRHGRDGGVGGGGGGGGGDYYATLGAACHEHLKRMLEVSQTNGTIS